MNSKTGELDKLTKSTAGWVQLDLYDPIHNWAFDSKVGYRSYNDAVDNEANSQAALVQKGHLNGVTWASLTNSVGDVGFSKGLIANTLGPLGIRAGYWTAGLGMTWYKWPWSV